MPAVTPTKRCVCAVIRCLLRIENLASRGGRLDMRDRVEKYFRQLNQLSCAFCNAVNDKNGKSLLLLALVLCGHVDYHGCNIDRVSKETS